MRQAAHFRALRDVANELVLIDTPAQLDAVHQDRDLRYTVREYAAAHPAHRAIRVRSTTEFETTRDNLDVAFCVAVFDVVPPRTRQSILGRAVEGIHRRADAVMVSRQPE